MSTTPRLPALVPPRPPSGTAAGAAGPPQPCSLNTPLVTSLPPLPPDRQRSTAVVLPLLPGTSRSAERDATDASGGSALTDSALPRRSASAVLLSTDEQLRELLWQGDICDPHPAARLLDEADVARAGRTVFSSPPPPAPAPAPAPPPIPSSSPVAADLSVAGGMRSRPLARSASASVRRRLDPLPPARPGSASVSTSGSRLVGVPPLALSSSMCDADVPAAPRSHRYAFFTPRPLSARAFPGPDSGLDAAATADGGPDETPLQRLRRERAQLRARLAQAQSQLQEDIGMLKGVEAGDGEALDSERTAVTEGLGE